MKISSLTETELIAARQILQKSYQACTDQGYNLDLTRGKPSSAQLDLSNELDGILGGFYLLQDGTDVRNYGNILGIPEARQLGAEILGVGMSETMVGGNSSLTLMYNFISHMMPVWSEEAGEREDAVKFICPVPGYDRHFTLCEHFGIEMINVDLLAGGPDMAAIEKLVKEDPMIKAVWCVPRYSNPTGHTYDQNTVKAFARLDRVAGKDFRVLWDNAYAVHDLIDESAQLHNLMDEAKSSETENSVVMFASTSKITFAGAGIAFLATSTTNLKAFEQFLGPQVIGFDKVNQLRHVRFLKDLKNLKTHMNKHKALLKPKFDLVEEKLKSNLGDSGVADWTNPTGGYFVSLNTLPGLANEVVRLAAGAGVKLTPAGATFPYGLDHDNRNIRIAPTYPSLDDLGLAMNVLVVSIQLASVNHLLDR